MSEAHLIAFAGANMPAEILDGKAIAKQIQTETKQKVADFVAAGGAQPKLAAGLANESGLPASLCECPERRQRSSC